MTIIERAKHIKNLIDKREHYFQMLKKALELCDLATAVEGKEAGDEYEKKAAKYQTRISELDLLIHYEQETQRRSGRGPTVEILRRPQ
jgi:hypothetical protein